MPESGVPSASVIAVGDELLYGSTIDTNGAWIGERFAQLGVPVGHRTVVGDSDADIGRALAAALEQSDVVIVSGGLGPTPDDHTREAVAAQLALELRLDPAVLEELEERFRRFGYTTLPSQNAQQAMVPEGARVLHNRHGSAPGLEIVHEGRLVFLLPGVPVEMRGLFEDEVEPAVRAALETRLRRVRHRLIHTTGIAESVLSGKVTDLLPEDMRGVSIAYLPRLIGVDVRLTATDHDSEEEAAAALDHLHRLIENAWQGHEFEAESGDLVEALGRELARRGWTVGAAESCTGGLVMKRLTRHGGASRFFRGGVVAYDNTVKTDALGVPHDLLERDGAVSESVALAMAEGVRRAVGSEVGIAITGIAGPDGGTEEKPVGTVWYAVAVGDRATAKCRRFHGDRRGVRIRAAQAALNLLYRSILE